MHDAEYRREMENELQSILSFWTNHTIDAVNGGFVGKVDNENRVYPAAPKGAVLNARILWAFSAAYNYNRRGEYLALATRAYDYIRDHFIDPAYGGVYWSVDHAGNLLDGRKQVYALAFCLYGLSEYYAACNNAEALRLALQLFDAIETHSYHQPFGGYLEAFERNWAEAADQRLSAKDANEKKTMNTHLHIIEAYANLYKVQPSPQLKERIAALLQLFHTYFIDAATHHLKLFFDEAWQEKPGVVSYGHDIEAAWLLLHCAETIADERWISIFESHAVNIADAAARGLDTDGGLWYEYLPQQHTLVKEKHWWPQAEAMVGFYNAYQLTGSTLYRQRSLESWLFIQRCLLDKQGGEWYWGVRENYAVMQEEDKAGFWKCPYHNARACLEIIRRTRQQGGAGE